MTERGERERKGERVTLMVHKRRLIKNGKEQEENGESERVGEVKIRSERKREFVRKQNRKWE